MKKSFRCILACLLVLALSVPVFSGALAVEPAQYEGVVEAKTTSIDVSGVRNGRTFEAADTVVEEQVSPTDIVTIMVQLEGEPAAVKYADIKAAGSYRKQLLADQAEAAAAIEKAVNTEIDVKYNYSVIFNGFAFEGEYRLVDEINALPGYNAFVAAEWEAPEPMLSSSTDMVGAIAAWDIGYTGEGTTVAVLDTGVKVDHEAFANDPEVVKYTRDDIAAFLDSGDLVDSNLMNISNVYYSAKIPFRWNYNGHNYNVAHQYSDHGTHVAGIAAGNCDEIRGVAPDAQILAMQVFAPSGGASWDVIALALEDCVVLGADSANLSLGSACGVEDAYNPAYDEMLENCVAAGVNLAMAAGNDYDAGYENAWGGYNLVQNPDTGVVGSPSTWKRSLSVAANNNANKQGYYVEVGGNMFGYTENADNPVLISESVAGQTIEVVAIPGYGDVADFEGLDVEGKVALIQRGEINFVDKAANAQAAGAVCAIIYNNTTGNVNMVANDGGSIPFIFIGQDAGLTIIDCINNGDNMMYFSDEVATVPIPGGGEPSEFSSWGTTPTLAIKPEITAPGGQIYSATDPGFSGALYQAWDGTSMATPHVAGGMVIVTEYVEEMFPDLSTAEKQVMVDAILMSTADPINDAGGEYAAVRKQGAGEMNLEDAVTTKVYLSVEGQERPKLELGDDPDKTGEYTMTFKAHNFGDEDILYAVRPTVLIEAIAMLMDDFGGEPVIVYAGQSMKCSTEDCTIEAPATVNVPAEGEAEITVKVTLTDETKEFLDYYYTSGTYVEGFIELVPVGEGGSVLGDANHDGEITSDDALLILRHAMGTSILEDTAEMDINGDGIVNASDALLVLRVALGLEEPFTGYEVVDGADLSIPFLTFYGDWNYTAIIDRGYYYDDYSWQSHPIDNTVGYKKGNTIYGLGINPYIDTADLSYYMEDRNAVSPNGDNFIDTVNVLYVGFLRGTAVDKYVVYDENGQELETILEFEGNTKGFWTGDYYDQMGVNYGYFPTWNAAEYNEEDIVLSVQAYLNNDGRNNTAPFTLEANEKATWDIPIHVDTVVPTATALSLNGNTASITVTDDHYVAYVGVYTYDNGELGTLVSETGVFEETRGASTTVDLTAADGNLIVLGDYAGNENVYRITNGALVEIGGGWSQSTPGGSAEFFNPVIYGYGLNLTGNTYFYTDTNNMGGCYIAQNPDPGIEMQAGAYDGNGVVYAVSDEGKLYIITEEGFGNYLGQPVMVGNTGNAGFTEMAYDQTTDTLYGVELAGTLYEIDPDTASTTVVGDIPNGAVAIDFYNGQCYTVDIYGVFGTLDLDTMTQTDIAVTGRAPVTSAGNFYPQSGCFIGENFFWVSTEAVSQDSQLYQIARNGEYFSMGYILSTPGVIAASLFGAPEADATRTIAINGDLMSFVK